MKKEFILPSVSIIILIPLVCLYGSREVSIQETHPDNKIENIYYPNHPVQNEVIDTQQIKNQYK